jgi:hypothetical protein
MALVEPLRLLGRGGFADHELWIDPFRPSNLEADVQPVANPDGRQVPVLTNPGSARTIEVQLANMATSVALKAHSVTTLAWG